MAVAWLLARINERQWSEEDLCRSPGAADEELGRVKRRTDALNARRSELVDRLDEWVATHLEQDRGAAPHTETYGTVVDRMAIGWVRVTRMSGHELRPVAAAQLAELGAAYDILLSDVEAGRRCLPSWRSLKFYRAPAEVRS